MSNVLLSLATGQFNRGLHSGLGLNAKMRVPKLGNSLFYSYFLT